MAEVIFSLNGAQTKIKCNEEDLMKDICQIYSKAGSVDTSNMLLLYRGSKIDPNSKLIDQAKDKDKSNKRLSIVCVQLKNRESIKSDKKKDILMKRKSLRERNSIKDKPVIPPQINDVRKSIKKKIEINDSPKNDKNDKSDNNYNKDLNIFNDFFRTYSCEIDLTNQQNQNTINQLYNNNPSILQNNGRNFTEDTNIIIDRSLPIRPKTEIESIEKEITIFNSYD